jgi:hypothetical protein
LVTPYDLRPTKEQQPMSVTSPNEDDWFLSNSGAEVHFKNGADGVYMIQVPVGYFIRSYEFKFSNPADEVFVTSSSYDSDLLNPLSYSNTSSTGSGTVYTMSDDFGFAEDFVASTSDYIIFKIINNSNNHFYFKGGRILLNRCSSGCGMD